MSASDDPVILSINISVTRDGKLIAKHRCAPGYEDKFAMLLSAMSQGTLQENILNTLTTEAKNLKQKKVAKNIASYYLQYNAQALDVLLSQMKNDDPVVKPSEVFSKQLKKFRGAK